MTRDENKYKDAHKFNPDRYFTADGELNNDDTILTFGFGRRCVLILLGNCILYSPLTLTSSTVYSICAGRHMADATVWGTIVSLLATFDVTKARDKDGNIIEVEEKYSDGVITCVTSQFRLAHLTSISLFDSIILRPATHCPLNAPLCLDPQKLKD